MAETTSRDFVRWRRFAELDMNTLTRGDYYLAQIAAEVRRGNVKHPAKVKIEDLVIKFKTRVAGKRVDPDEVQRRTAQSKAAWFGITNAKKILGKIRRQDEQGPRA